MSEVKCPVCDKLFEKTHHSQKYCEEHRNRKNRVDAGWCRYCRAAPALDDNTLCGDCNHHREYFREYQREYWRENREYYREYQREYERERYANDPEYRNKHIKKAQEYQRKLRALRRERTEYLKSLPVDKLLSIAKDNLEVD